MHQFIEHDAECTGDGSVGELASAQLADSAAKSSTGGNLASHAERSLVLVNVVAAQAGGSSHHEAVEHVSALYALEPAL